MNATLAEIDDALNRARETRRRYSELGNTAGVTVANTFLDRLLDERFAFAAHMVAA
jgi:hypothetical protein